MRSYFFAIKENHSLLLSKNSALCSYHIIIKKVGEWMNESLITSFNNIIPYVPSMIGNEFRFHTHPSSEYVFGDISDIKQDAEKRIVLIRSFGSAYRCSAQLKPDQNIARSYHQIRSQYSNLPIIFAICEEIEDWIELETVYTEAKIQKIMIDKYCRSYYYTPYCPVYILKSEWKMIPQYIRNNKSSQWHTAIFCYIW